MNEWVDDALTIARALAEFDNHELHDLSPADQDRYGRQAVFVVEKLRHFVPNAETVAAMERARSGEGMERFKTVDELMTSLEADV
jgi:hypothetical protein